MWHIGDGWGWWMVMGWVWMVVFWGLVIWLAFTLVARVSGERRRESYPGATSALEVLERRYAAGELTDTEFEAMRERLRGSTPASPTAAAR